MTFAWAPARYAGIDAFRQSLAAQQRPSWVRSCTIHHTWRPLPADWRGLKSIESLGRFYRDDKDWPAGPHLFLCIGAPDPANDGIFVGTPLSTKGVHAGACNSDRWGIEIVGNYDLQPWPASLADLVYGVVLALALFGDFDPATVNGHRECLPNKSCPGTAINMNAVRLEVQRRAAMPTEPDYAALWGSHVAYFAGSGIELAWRPNAAVLGNAVSDETKDARGHVWRLFDHGAIDYSPAGIAVYVPRVKP